MSEAWAKGSDARWRRFREWLLQQWALQGRTRCEVQGPLCTQGVEQVDHIIPLARGGAKYDVRNCQPSCAPCNKAKGSSTPSPQPEPRTVSSW